MKPFLEHLAQPVESSWVIFDRRLPRIPFEWHYHPEYELTLTLNSRGQRFVGDDVSPYEHGDLVLLGPRVPHTWNSSESVSPGREHQAIVLWFRDAFVESMIGAHVEFHPVRILLDRASRGVQFSEPIRAKAERTISGMLQQNASERLISFLSVLMLLAEDREAQCLCSTANGMVTLPSATEDRVGRVIAHLHENYRSEISIDALARIGALSRSSLHRLFKLHARMTVHEYITQLRIGNACALLLNTGKPVSVIADEVGYNNLANFNRQFRALKHQTPRGFRAAHGG